MEKTIKKLSIIALMLIMVITLVGCGKKEDDDEEKKEKIDDNTIIATKDNDEDGIKYKEETEIKLKDNKVDNVKMTMTFDDEETAKEMKDQVDSSIEFMKMMGLENLEIKISQNGKKVIMELDSESFSLIAGVDVSEEEVTKAELKKALEEDGYEVK